MCIKAILKHCRKCVGVQFDRTTKATLIKNCMSKPNVSQIFMPISVYVLFCPVYFVPFPLTRGP